MNIFSQCTKDAKIIFSRIQIFFIATLFSNYKWSTVDRMPFINTRCAFNNSLGLGAAVCIVESTVEFVIQPTFTWYCFSGKLGSYRQKVCTYYDLFRQIFTYKRRVYLGKIFNFGSKKFIELEIPNAILKGCSDMEMSEVTYQKILQC